MDLSILTYYITIAKELSFSSAADELFLSQSSLSKQIKRLENELGVTLFQRNSHGIALTSAGKSLLPFAQRISLELETIQEHFAQPPSPTSMSLRIAAFSLLSSYGIDELISDFIIKHQEISTSVREMSSARCLEALDGGTVDCCFSYDYGQFDAENHTSIPLCTDRLAALCGSTNPLIEMDQVLLSQLEDYHICVPSSVNEPLFLHLLKRNIAKTHSPIQEIGVWLNSLNSFLQRNPDTICVLPAQVAEHNGIPGIPISDAEPFSLSLVFPSDSVLPAFPILLRELEPYFQDIWHPQENNTTEEP